MTKWEYKIIDPKEPSLRQAKTIDEVQTYLNSLGAEGWEIIVYGSILISDRGLVGSRALGLAKRPRS